MKTRTLLLPVIETAAAVALITYVAGCAGFTNLRGNTQYGADKHLTGKVENELEKDPLYKYPNVSVTVYRGEVQLGGTVNQENQRERAIKDAQAVPGVLKVSDNMIVNTNAPVVPE